MSDTAVEPERITTLERVAAAAAYVMGAVPALINLDPYLHFVGTLVPRRLAEQANIAVLIGIIVLWLGFQAMERGFVRAHVAQMAAVVFLAGIVGWLVPGPAPLGEGIGPLIAGVLVLVGILALGGTAWAGVPPSLPVIGRLSRRWGRYERRENT
ncbi:MAG: hypothetical protein AB7G21_03125 [Dehalococcoidia bacterium]